MSDATVLLVDDEPGIRFAIAEYLQASGYNVVQADSCRTARDLLRSASPDAIILDYKLPDCTSNELIPEIKYVDAHCPILILTAHGSIDLAVQLIKSGADQFMTKPVELAALRVMIDRLVANRRARKREVASRPKEADRTPFAGSSAEIQKVYAEGKRIAQSDSPILLQGETGSGKGVLARWLHEVSRRSEEPFVDLNCAGLSRELLESELFGYERGAFTGAMNAKQGLLEVGQNGSIFLDEVGDMDLTVQAKLLKVVEERTFRRLGDVRDRKLNIRLICATHHDLATLVREKRFREDLYFRISTFNLQVPSLRERRDDVTILAEHFVEHFARELGHPRLELDSDAVRVLREYSWPGNVRELRNVIERAVLLADGDTIRITDLRFDGGSRPHAAAANPADVSLTLADVERGHIQRVLADTGGRVDLAAQRLGISRSSLYQRIKAFGLDRQG